MTENKFVMRFAGEGDLDEIYKIEVELFEKPFSLQSFNHEFRVSFSTFIVVEHLSGIVAYAIAWKVHDEIHLNKIAVKKKFQKAGIGKAIIDFITESINPGYARVMLIEVREKDSGARRFYEKIGFKETGIRKSYYIDDNAVLMEREINSVKR